MNDRFWTSIDKLVEDSEIKIDRPKGSLHPRNESVIYPMDYGFLEGTRSGDQHEIDVWLGSNLERGVTAIVCTIDLWKSDAEVKLLIGCTKSEAQRILEFHNRGSQSAVLIERHGT